ncbi:ATP-binding cassette domain-containing protein [Candidatus Marsarchaeota archaeon]|nr:ATP-binding cassette domain-containing protein [Candidatus Marsarchaeota archaeon]
MILEIKDLHADAEQRNVIKGLNLKIGDGELHVLMGPNGSGKTTLAKTIMGHPQIRITKGTISANGILINDLPVNERAKLGLFLEFQNPVEIEGLGLMSFLNSAMSSLNKEKISLQGIYERDKVQRREPQAEGGPAWKVPELRILRRGKEEDGDIADVGAKAKPCNT